MIIADPCRDFDEDDLEVPDQETGLQDAFTGADIVFELNPFEVTPSSCEVEYECVSISGSLSCVDFNADEELVFTATGADYQNNNLVPGINTVTVSGTVKNSSPTVSKEFTFTIELIDPCDPPTSLTAATLVDQTYEIAATAEEYEHGAFVVDPDYCPLIYSAAETTFTDSDGD